MNDEMDADELAKKVNDYVGNVGDEDKRFSQLTKRRILDYTTKGLLKKPLKNGNRNYYTDEHFQQLIKLRELQMNAGMSEKTLMKAVASTSTNSQNDVKDDCQIKALSILNSFGSSSSTKIDETSDRILKSIGTEYVSSSALMNVSGSMTRSFPMSGNNLLKKVDDEMKFANLVDSVEMEMEDTQRNNRGILKNQLNTSFYSGDKIYAVIPGMKVVIDSNFELTEQQEKLVKEFMEKFVDAYRKITDGS